MDPGALNGTAKHGNGVNARSTEYPMEPEKLDFHDYVAILKRRIWVLVIPAVFVIALAFPIIFTLPPTYQSKATVLIEDQAIPRDLVRSTVTSFAAERLEVITQRVTATQNLVDVINKLELYRDRRAQQTMTELAEQARKRFKLKMIEANVNSPDSGGGKATIAFTLSFEDRSPDTARAVVNELVSLYISENLRTRRQNAEETKQFLEQEMQRVSSQISTLEASLARFKERNAANLPEQVKLTLGALERAEQQLLTTQRRLEVLRERKIFLEAQLAQVDPYLRPSAVANKDDLSPEERLRVLRSQLVQLRARYGTGHPDVVRLIRQISLLEREVPKDQAKRGDDQASVKRDLDTAKEELAEARRKYADAHPDVVRLQRRVSELEKAVRAAPATSERPPGIQNPAYAKLKQDLWETDVETKTLVEQEKTLRQQISTLQQQASKAPEVEREYLLLQRNLEFALSTQRELSAKLRQARMGEALELERKGERFALIEPPSLPKEPSSPNRPVYLLVAFIFALGFGAASVAGFEVADNTIHSPRQLTLLAGAAPLVVLPELVSSRQRQKRRNWRYAALIIVGLMLAIAAYLVFVMEVFGPIDVIRARIGNRVDLWLKDIGIY